MTARPPSKLPAFWKNLVLFSFEKLTVVTRAANGRLKEYRFPDGLEMISFYEKCTGIPFGSKRAEDPERLLEWPAR
jgi:hypothetical protein